MPFNLKTLNLKNQKYTLISISIAIIFIGLSYVLSYFFSYKISDGSPFIGIFSMLGSVLIYSPLKFKLEANYPDLFNEENKLGYAIKFILIVSILIVVFFFQFKVSKLGKERIERIVFSSDLIYIKATVNSIEKKYKRRKGYWWESEFTYFYKKKLYTKKIYIKENEFKYLQVVEIGIPPSHPEIFTINGKIR